MAYAISGSQPARFGAVAFSRFALPGALEWRLRQRKCTAASYGNACFFEARRLWRAYGGKRKFAAKAQCACF
jgi:hypothetical protein